MGKIPAIARKSPPDGETWTPLTPQRCQHLIPIPGGQRNRQCYRFAPAGHLYCWQHEAEHADD